jgi:predicted metal-dependent hydrolase
MSWKGVVLLGRWQQLLGVSVQRFFVQRMKTRWGSCNPKTGTIRLNTDLAKKPRGCLEYLVIHEIIHLIEPTHNARFVALMDGAMPRWRHCFCRPLLQMGASHAPGGR